MFDKVTASISILLVNVIISTSVYGVEKKYIIGFHKEPGVSESAMIESMSGRVRETYRHVQALAVELDEIELAGLLNNPDVAYIEEDNQISAIDPVAVGSPDSGLLATGGIEYDNAWSVTLIGTEMAHSQSVTGAGVNVAILDTGVDYNHPDLDQNYSGGDNFVSLDVNNHDPMDDSFNSHGTHVAGIVAAEHNGAGVVGVAPNASIHALKVLDGAGFGSVSALVSGIDWAISNQIDIVNMSMGLTTYSQALYDACMAAEAADVLLVAAAGNSYGGPVLYPAAFPSVMAVGATTIFGEISPLSPVGPELEMVAPGLNVYSTVAGGGYGYLGGTSQSAPHVTGLAALLLSAGMVEDRDGNGQINNHDTRIMIQESAIDLGVTGVDEIYGFGLVDVAGPFSGTGEFPVIHLTAEKLAGLPDEYVEKMTIEDGLFDVTIVNSDLYALKMLVYEGETLRRDLTEKLRFAGGYNRNVGAENIANPYQQELNFVIDATGTAYTLVFYPYGMINAFADIYVQKQP